MLGSKPALLDYIIQGYSLIIEVPFIEKSNGLEMLMMHIGNAMYSWYQDTTTPNQKEEASWTFKQKNYSFLKELTNFFFL